MRKGHHGIFGAFERVDARIYGRSGTYAAGSRTNIGRLKLWLMLRTMEENS